MKKILESFKNIQYKGLILTAGKIGEYILLLAVASLFIYFVVRSIFGSPDEMKRTNKKVDKIELAIDSLSNQVKLILADNEEIKQNQAVTLMAIDDNNAKIDRNYTEISKIKKLYNEKINVVTNYSPNQLDSFFATKYKAYYNKK